MALVPLTEYDDAPAAVRAVYDDIKATRNVDWIISGKPSPTPGQRPSGGYAVEHVAQRRGVAVTRAAARPEAELS